MGFCTCIDRYLKSRTEESSGRSSNLKIGLTEMIPPLATEKDRDAAFDWPKSKPEQDDVWSYMISNGSEILVVSAEEFEGGGSGCDDNGRQ